MSRLAASTFPTRPQPEAIELIARDPALEAARREAQRLGLGYAGDVGPADAWRLVLQGRALLVDVRTAEERHYVGQVPGSAHVPWAQGFPMTRNPRFAEQLRDIAQPSQVLLMICRSGKRSVSAAERATAAGHAHAYNVLEGFEGDLDAARQRGQVNGWRRRGLPWVQD